MYEEIVFYRITCFGQPRGPWRLDKEQARRDAISEGLGQYDERGRYFSVVPGAMQCVRLPKRLILAAASAEAA
jgi:hypothetical protein